MPKVGKIQKNELGPRILSLLTEQGKGSKEIAAILTEEGFKISQPTVFGLIKDERESCGVEPLLDAHQVKHLLRCSLPWVYKAADQGLIPSVKIPCPGEGKKKRRTMVRFKRNDIFEFIEKHYQIT